MKTKVCIEFDKKTVYCYGATGNISRILYDSYHNYRLYITKQNVVYEALKDSTNYIRAEISATNTDDKFVVDISINADRKIKIHKNKNSK